MAKQEVLHNQSSAAALVIQHAKRLRSIMVPSVVCPSLLYLFTLSHIANDFQKNALNLK
jgi:hypothetical protein